MSNITLQSLIKKQKKRIKLLQNRVVGADISDYYPDMQAYYDWAEITQRFLDLHFKGDKYIEKFCTLCDESFSLVQQEKLLAILNAFVAFPITIKNDVQMENEEKANFVVNVTNNNTQSQNQEQSIIVQQILDAFRDELTGRQLKELESIIAKADNDLHKAKPNIIAKLMEFGGNVVSNILATILTNSASGLYL